MVKSRFHDWNKFHPSMHDHAAFLCFLINNREIPGTYLEFNDKIEYKTLNNMTFNKIGCNFLHYNKINC